VSGTDADAEQWLFTTWSTVGWIIVSAVLMLLAVVVVVRITGLRSLAKMSSVDFTVTVAIGSILGSVVASGSPISQGAVAVAALLGVQWLVAQFRRRSFGSRVVDNTPVLLVRDGQFIEEAMTKERVTRSDVYARLRRANVHRMDQVIAVVLETTGDISVVHGEGPLDRQLYDNIRQFRPNGPLTREER
jgi:uncharacterized membrane protein YcaP (DUF421 family)